MADMWGQHGFGPRNRWQVVLLYLVLLAILLWHQLVWYQNQKSRNRLFPGRTSFLFWLVMVFGSICLINKLWTLPTSTEIQDEHQMRLYRRLGNNGKRRAKAILMILLP